MLGEACDDRGSTSWPTFVFQTDEASQTIATEELANVNHCIVSFHSITVCIPPLRGYVSSGVAQSFCVNKYIMDEGYNLT